MLAISGKANGPWPEAEQSKLITLRVKNSEGVRITRMMRRSDKLRDLTDFYLAMYYGRSVRCDQTPVDYDMEEGDEVGFFPNRTSLPVTLSVKGNKGRTITRTMRGFDTLNVLFDLYFAMLPSTAQKWGFFMYQGRNLHGELPPENYEMEDGAEITFVPISKPSMFVTLKMKGNCGHSVTRTMRRTDKLQNLVDFYHAMVPTSNYEHSKCEVVYCGRQVEGEKTPADYEMEDGDLISLSPVTTPVTKRSFDYDTDDDDEYSFYSVSKRSMFVTIKLVGVLPKNIQHTHTLRSTDELQGLMDLCSSMMPTKFKYGLRFIFDGRCVRGSQTPDDLLMEDGDMVDVFPCLIGGCMVDS